MGMKKLSVFLYSSIVNKKVYDEFNDVIGILKDAYVTAEEGYPKIIGYRIKRSGTMYEYEFKNIDFILMTVIRWSLKQRVPRRFFQEATAIFYREICWTRA